ncbi:PAS domain-containing sensor histidine kinase [Bradyrhizobium canariense]|uniref:PAS domain-containing sensor histidine kinase n=1 Tax=Bradyrhizobium canariense TaxID=255045 RepID=UPI001B89EF0C|nr:HAMP domain-containing sensor histidine kinase [Bradyrhizobium canariense]MBR0952124.1 HAMP domain-containing histidine kinase [Bradyrhizobium canariense]
MFENAPCAYITLLPNGRIQRVNKTLLGWIGHTAEHMGGKRFSDFLNMAGRIYFETHIAPLLRMQGSYDEFAIDMVTAAGEPLQMIANAREGRDAAGKALFTRLALIKATDRRRYERELLQARDVAKTNLESERETSELREQFIAVLGHDLRNPLASISAGARILGREAKSDKEHQVIAMLETTVLRMAGLIDNVLDFARGRLGGGIALDRNASKLLEPVLHQVIDELRLASPGRLIEAEYAIDVPVDCDRSRIGQLVSNLVGNALSHGSSNEPVRVRAVTEDGLFRLSVANDGEPIPEAAMAKLFEPFFRGEVRASRQGLGLGLHIAAQIAKAHEGRLTVSSTREETCFTFVMPLRQRSQDHVRHEHQS